MHGFQAVKTNNKDFKKAEIKSMLVIQDPIKFPDHTPDKSRHGMGKFLIIP